MITKIDIASQHKRIINLRVEYFSLASESFVANIQVTNIQRKPFNFDIFELHVNGLVYKQVPVVEINHKADHKKEHSGKYVQIITHKTFFPHITNALTAFPFCPYLQYNEMVHGLVLIPGPLPRNITSALLRMPVAGYDDYFEYRLVL